MKDKELECKNKVIKPNFRKQILEYIEIIMWFYLIKRFSENGYIESFSSELGIFIGTFIGFCIRFPTSVEIRNNSIYIKNQEAVLELKKSKFTKEDYLKIKHPINKKLTVSSYNPEEWVELLKIAKNMTTSET